MMSTWTLENFHGGYIVDICRDQNVSSHQVSFNFFEKLC